MRIPGTLKEDLKKKIYLISFDLSGKVQNYDKLVAEIKKFPGWCKLWDTQWFVCSDATSSEICSKLRKVLDGSDWMFVCNVTNDRMGLLSSNVVEWLQDVSKKQK